MSARYLLRDPAFRLFLAAYATSLFGSHLAGVALVFAILQNGGDASDVGLAMAARIIPLILFLPVGGLLGDRLPRRIVLLSADALRTVSQGGIALLFLLGVPELAPVLLLAALGGAGEGLFMPSLGGIVPALADRSRLQDANSLLSVTRSTALIAGPALGGLLVAVHGATTVLVIDTLCFGLSVLALAFLRVSEDPQPEPDDPAGEGLLRRLGGGWRHIRSRAWLGALVLQGALFNLLVWGPYLVLGPVAADEWYGGAGAWGLIMAGYGAGAVVTGLLLLGRRPRRPLVVLVLTGVLWSGPLATLAAGLPLPLVVAGAALAGCAVAVSESLLHTTIQRRVPESALSRVMSWTTLGSFALGPLGLALAGPVAEAVGVRAVLGFGAGWQVLACLAVLAIPSVRALRGDDPRHRAGTAR